MRLFSPAPIQSAPALSLAYRIKEIYLILNIRIFHYFIFSIFSHLKSTFNNHEIDLSIVLLLLKVVLIRILYT